MKIIKFTAICSLSIFIVINAAIPAFTTAGGLIDMGYGSRGKKYAGGRIISF